ncbi:MAG: Twin-arginine translocation pathway signal [Frankiales bacterium]|nr:Twin-arginine translocation pathway signal [Frankiales bacterium]
MTTSHLTRRRLLGLGAGLGAAALLSACGDDSSASPRAAGSSSGAEPVTVRTCVYAKNHASSPLFWQKFAPANYRIEVTPVTSSAQIQDGLEAGQLDFGLLGAYTTVIAAAKGTPFTSRIVSMTARQGLALIGRKGVVDTVADLKGKKVAVPPPGAQVLILNEVLRQAGLTLGKDVQGIPLAYADHPTALERGDVQAYIGTEPLCTQSVVAGIGTRIDVRGTPVGDFNTANWASGKILKERPDVVREVCTMQKAAAEYLTPGGVNDKAVWKDLLVTQFGYTEPVYEAVLENVGAVWEFDKTREDQVRGAGKLLVAQGGIAKEPDYEKLFAREYWDV